jgi:hypothetical protein
MAIYADCSLKMTTEACGRKAKAEEARDVTLEVRSVSPYGRTVKLYEMAHRCRCARLRVRLPRLNLARTPRHS